MSALLFAAVLMGDVQVSACSRIESSESIMEIVVHGIKGAIEHRKAAGSAALSDDAHKAIHEALLSIGHEGWRPVLRRVLKVLGFVFLDSPGAVEYSYDTAYKGKQVHRWACIKNGNVQTTTTLTGDMGNRRVRQAQLVIVANEVSKDLTEINLEIRVDLRLGCIGRRIAQRQVCQRLQEIVEAGRKAVEEGRSAPEAMTKHFVESHP